MMAARSLADRESLALCWAARNGHIRVVKALLKDGRADPTDRYYEAMRVAQEGGHTEVVALLVRVVPRRKRWNSRCGTVHTVVTVVIYFNAQ